MKYFVFSAAFSFLYYFLVFTSSQCYPVFVSFQVIFHLFNNYLFLPRLDIWSHKEDVFCFLSFTHFESPILSHSISSVIKCFGTTHSQKMLRLWYLLFKQGANECSVNVTQNFLFSPHYLLWSLFVSNEMFFN